MDKILNYIKLNYVKILIASIAIIFSFRGIQGYWSDFKENIFQSRLKEEGVSLEIEERVVLKELATATIATEESLSEVKKVDYQTYKNAKAKQKGITVTDSDVKHIKSADSLLSKWRKRPVH